MGRSEVIGALSRNPLSKGLHGWMLRQRNLLLSSERFRESSLKIPFISSIGRRQARRLFDLTAGFVYSQILYACVDLKLFDFLSERPRTLAETAEHCNMPSERAQRLLDAAAALDLVSSGRDGKYYPGPLGSVLANNAGLSSMILHHRHLYADLADPVDLLRAPGRETALSKYWGYARNASPSDVESSDAAEYSMLMSASQTLIAGLVIDAYNFAEHRHLLDIGGGSGNFLLEAKRRHGRLTCSLFDLPAVVELAKANIAQRGVQGSVNLFGGDFTRDPIPQGADLMTLVRILHDHDDDAVQQLLRSVFSALPPGGVLLIAEPLAESGQDRRMGHAYFGFYLMAMGQGRPRSLATLSEYLRAAGFVDIHQIATRVPLQTSLICARRA